MRDLLTVLGIDKVTVIGHSFGGGVAMQFAYQFPERTERLMLVASGGLGPEVSPGHPGDHHPRLPPGDGRADAARRPARRHGRAARAVERAVQAHPRPRRGRRDLRLLQGPARPRTRSGTWSAPSSTGAARSSPWPTGPTSPRRCRCAVVWGRDDQVIPVRHASNAGRARAERPGRGDPERRALPAQGPPAAVRQDRARVHPHDPARDVQPGPVPRRCSRRPGRRRGRPLTPRSPASERLSAQPPTCHLLAAETARPRVRSQDVESRRC